MRGPLAHHVRLSIIGAAIAAALLQADRVQTKDAVPTDEGAIVHALSRLTFGATPQGVELVKKVGLANWIDRQLEPMAIADRALEARLATFETLTLSSSVIAAEYDRPARLERRQAQQRSNGADAPPATPAPSASMGSEPARPARAYRPAPSAAQIKSREILTQLSDAKLLRAVYSERQLQEVLVDFWFNHFNVFAGKGKTENFVTEYEREAIRPHVLGSFRDLLEATAKSPAMLFYLDNWTSSAAPDAATLTPARRKPAKTTAGAPMPRGRRRGVNENYARELLELHTLGVDGGYTQADIVNVARAFTGWTLDRRDEGGFRFAAALHDAGEKRVLGQTIAPGGGEQDGERVLDILAAHPATARFIATKLARRFVSDQPPAALVARVAATFQQTHGDLRDTVRTLITSPEFFAAEARHAKVKTPLEFVASTLRATGAEVTNARPLTRVLRELGMPLYLCQPPTGYADTADTWVSSGALVNRLNFAMDLASGRLKGIDLPDLGSDPAVARDRAQGQLLPGRASDATIATMTRAVTTEQTWALAIGSPEFQRK